MKHSDFQPQLNCPGFVKPDRYRHESGEQTRKWYCTVCHTHFLGTVGRIAPTQSVPPELIAERIRKYKETNP